MPSTMTCECVAVDAHWTAESPKVAGDGCFTCTRRTQGGEPQRSWTRVYPSRRGTAGD